MLKNKCSICSKEISDEDRFCCRECGTISMIMSKNNNFKMYLNSIYYFVSKYDPKEALKRYRYCRNFRTFFQNLHLIKVVDSDEYFHVLNRIENMQIDIDKLKSQLVPNIPDRWLTLGFNNDTAFKISQLFSTRRNSFVLRNGVKDGNQKYNSWHNKISISKPNLKSCYFSKEYWLSKGYSAEESKEIISRNNTRDIKYFVNKYGHNEGIKKYNEMRKKRSMSSSKTGFIKNHSEDEYFLMIKKKSNNINNFIKRYGKLKGEQKYQEYLRRRLSYQRISKPQKIIESILHSNFNDVKKDFVIKDRLFDYKVGNVIIEVNGDWWHMNPLIYNNDYFNSVIGKTSIEVWEYDKNKINLANDNSFSTITIWERLINSNIEFSKVFLRDIYQLNNSNDILNIDINFNNYSKERRIYNVSEEENEDR